MWNPPSKSVGDSPVSTSLLSRKPLSPRGIGHITTPEKRQRKSSAVRGLSTESFQPSGIVDTMFEKRRGKSTALCLQTLDEEIIKKEGASAAQREAADSRRKRERRFKCRICGDTLTSSQNLKNHTNSHTGNKPYKCEYCQDKNFRHLRSLSRHVKKKHS
ncbi:hypothetical protein AGABI1DRAFT_121272 [Agaricus bisporus var. burnettii JB137-S8]|uniref:C2H2-type domain-containing protein n=1 Tax=Agaricus bisporus var. burnettii (strain JB137-S8 / ATCC MYA-4627 / FGSC 10392) TaxID=597362 RepID=K5WTX8_AGABU|nr:uncharacterized protein AGABI1DRAFT_121272 [Agaricus bisporus var. burnettii JB137-S8]EKM78896.1 hypothetical protein AGABI1DRAFT_121272 [Agaricus bisporus var. burnettii JB137-S8]